MVNLYNLLGLRSPPLGLMMIPLCQFVSVIQPKVVNLNNLLGLRSPLLGLIMIPLCVGNPTSNGAYSDGSVMFFLLLTDHKITAN